MDLNCALSSMQSLSYCSFSLEALLQADHREHGMHNNHMIVTCLLLLLVNSLLIFECMQSHVDTSKTILLGKQLVCIFVKNVAV